MPRVQVQLFAALRQLAGGQPAVEVEIAAGDSVAAVLDKLGIAHDKPRIIFVNNRAAGLDQPLQGGEQLALFPAIGGG
jgi:molybdopterin converting factor small subunit